MVERYVNKCIYGPSGSLFYMDFEPALAFLQTKVAEWLEQSRWCGMWYCGVVVWWCGGGVVERYVNKCTIYGPSGSLFYTDLSGHRLYCLVQRTVFIRY